MAVSTFGAASLGVLKDPIDGTLPWWTKPRHVVELPVPGGTDHVTQLLGSSRARVSLRLYVADQTAYDALDALCPSTATLTIAGTSYGSCVLRELASEVRFSDGSIEVDAVFEKTT